MPTAFFSSSLSFGLIEEFAKERSIRRILRVWKAKRSRIDDDLNQLVTHLNLLVPLSHKQGDTSILLEAIARLDDEGFAQLLTKIVVERNS